MLKNKKGFTLIELMVVVLIVGVLSTIAHLSYTTYRKRARKFDAKKTLGTIITVAEAFRSNTGFYLPSLDQMHVPFKGKLEYSYVITCLKGSGDTINFGHDQTIPCGGFEVLPTMYYPPPPPSPLPVDPVDSAKDNCWMGYVLYHTVRFYHPRKIQNLPPGDQFPCGATPISGLVFPSDYSVKGSFTNVVSFPTPEYDPSNKGADDNAITAAAEKFFAIRDSRELCGDRVEYDENVLDRNKNCFSVKQYAVDPSKVEALLTSAMGSTDETKRFYISSPSRLSVSALACSGEDEEDCGGVNPPQTQEYHIITLDSRRVLKTHSGSSAL